MELLLETAKRRNHTFFKISGDLNYEGTLRLKNAFEEAFAQTDQHFILDLKGCKIISSFALSMLLKLNDSIKEKNGTFKIICPSGDILDVFDVLDIRNVIPIYISEEELWQHSGSGAPE
jgi:anti-anti-sigma factor